MLQAKTKFGKTVLLASLTKEEREIARRQSFYCPTCKKRVIVKAGPKVIPHFAHYQATNCTASGGEGTYHEQGKLLLFQWLRRQRLAVQLEKYLPAINQRPDLLLTINQRQIAIEFQCSRVPSRQIRQRNQGYKQAGIIPLW